jgi:pimeloyl-ACP methyl ester carboxylesterase
MKELAMIMSQQIDTIQPYILVGHSLGGMLCVEMSDFLNPEKVIIISSAKCRKELPIRYKFMKFFPLNKIVPPYLYWLGAKVAQPLVEPDRKNNKETFKAMLRDKDPKFFYRTTNIIIHWKRESYDSSIVHIHGNHDHTLPLKKIRPNYIIENGSHMMALTRAEEISELLNEILKEK